MHLKDADKMADNVDLDQTAPLGAKLPYLGLHCLPKLRIIMINHRDNPIG